MPGKSLLLLCAVALAAIAGSAEARSVTVTGSAEARNVAIAAAPQSRSELISRADDGSYLPGRRSFYNYPRHRHIEGGGEKGASFGGTAKGSDDRSPNIDRNYGSPYYGANYGAPYFGGGYYDGGVYYRERRD